MIAKKIFNARPPNGRWGWMVVLGSFVIKIFDQSLVFIFGFLYGFRFAELDFNQKQISLIMNLSNVFTNVSGWVIGIAMEYFSVRQVGMFGCLMISCGIMLSSLASTLTEFILTYGVMVGMGFGFITSTSFLAVCSYFTTKKNRAVSIAMSGTGFGQTMLPQIVNLLMPVYGSRGTILIVGGLALNGLVGALLFQPVEWHLIDVGAPADPLLSSPITDTNKQPTEQKPNFKSRLRNVIDWNLIRDLRFMIFSVGLSCGYTIIMDLLMILPFFLQKSANLDSSNAAFCLSLLAAADVFSRLTFHFATDKFKISCRMNFALSIFAVGIFCLILVELRNFYAIAVACAFVGYFKAIAVVSQYLSIAEYCKNNYPDSDNLAHAVGINMIIKSLCVVSIGQLFGWVRDILGNYTVTFYMHNVLITIILISWILEHKLCGKR